jgi:hypothetical protein
MMPDRVQPRIDHHLATDRYLSRGERSMPPLSPSLAAGTAAIFVRRTSLVRRTWKAGTGRAEYIEQREGIYRLSRRSGLQIHLFSSHPVRLAGSGDGLADLLVRAAGITELLANSVSFAVVVGFKYDVAPGAWCE